VAVAGHYSLTLSDVNSLKLWEMNHLIEEMDEKKTSGPTTGQRKHPPGSTPVVS